MSPHSAFSWLSTLNSQLSTIHPSSALRPPHLAGSQLSTTNSQLAPPLRTASLFAYFVCFVVNSQTAQAADDATPRDIYLPPENASQEALNLSARKSPLRFLGLDLFPHAAAAVQYDDNVLISPRQPIDDVQWILSPGLTVAAGDVSAFLPGTVTLDQLRNLLYYSLVDVDYKPQRYLGVDYTPSFNFFTDHSEFDNIDHLARLSGGYAFSRLALGLDQDIIRQAQKNNSAGTRLTTTTYTTRLKANYDLNDRSSLEANGQYLNQQYEENYQGYQELRNEDWYNRRLGDRLSVGAGAAFGLVYPETSADQTYQQALVRAGYRLSGKLDLRSSVGVEWRQIDQGTADSPYPVFSLSGIYHPWYSTAFTLEAHRRDQPSPTGGYNYATLGFSAGVRQQLLSRFYANLSAGYDAIDYTQTRVTTASDRSDAYLTLQASLDYELNPHWQAGLFYTHRRDDSNIPQRTYANNITGLRFQWRF